MPRRFLVTAGNTREKIDRVRDWGNIFTGNTGLRIARALADAGGEVHLLTSNRVHLAELTELPSSSRITASSFTDHAELRGALAALMAKEPYDAVFMTAAVADYHPAGAFEVVSREPAADGNERWVVRDVQAGKVKSTHDAIAFLGRRTEKLVDLFRTEWNHRGILVKFKLEVGISKDELIRIGQASRKASGAEYLIANTLDMVDGANAGAFLLSDGGERWITRDQLPRQLAELVRAVQPLVLSSAVKHLILIGCVMTVIASSSTARAEDSKTGASLAWTSDEPRIVELREFVFRGELAKAERLLAGKDGPADVEMREMIRRLRREYNTDQDALLKKLSPQISDLTEADIVRWREAGELQHRVFDGQVKYFRREPSNLFRFSEEAKKRRKQPADEASKWKLTDHLAKVIAEAERSGQKEVVPVKHTITFTATIPAGAGNAKVGSAARIWLPFPQEYRQQKDIKLVSSEPSPTKIADNGTPQRTLYFERVIDDPSKPIVVKTVYSYDSFAYYPDLKDESAKPLAADWAGAKEYLSERLPHIALTPELRAKVKEIVGAETNPLARARKIFHWINANVRYHAEEEYCVIPSISTKALTSLKGDCGVQGLLFVTMCRAAGVPARWQSGWETKPSGWNMHDWAEFYVEPWGWLPADPSYGLQKSEDPKVREFYFGHQDSYRMIVNLDYGRTLVPAKQSLRSEPADFQRGEAEIDGKNLYFDEWDYEFKFEQAGG